jgi:hypothetical protein
MGLLSWLFSDKYARSLMSTPGFASKLDSANAKLAELKRMRAERVAPGNAVDAEFAQSPNVLHCQAAIRECGGDEDKGFKLFQDRYNMMKAYGVTWDTASHAIQPGTNVPIMKELRKQNILKIASEMSDDGARAMFLRNHKDEIEGV